MFLEHLRVEGNQNDKPLVLLSGGLLTPGKKNPTGAQALGPARPSEPWAEGCPGQVRSERTWPEHKHVSRHHFVLLRVGDGFFPSALTPHGGVPSLLWPIRSWARSPGGPKGGWGLAPNQMLLAPKLGGGWGSPLHWDQLFAQLLGVNAQFQVSPWPVGSAPQRRGAWLSQEPGPRAWLERWGFSGPPALQAPEISARPSAWAGEPPPRAGLRGAPCPATHFSTSPALFFRS